MKEIVIFGAKEFAEIAHYYFTNDAALRVAAFTADAKYLNQSLLTRKGVVSRRKPGNHREGEKSGGLEDRPLVS